MPKELISEDGTIALRIVQDEFCRKLIEQINQPLVSTSANISGNASPAFFDEVSDEIKGRVGYIVEYRQTDRIPKTASRIIKVLADGTVEVIRG